MTTTAPDRSQRTATAIETDSLSRTFGEGDLAVHALVDVDLRIERGELVVLLGPSGSGKTTLLNLVGAIDQPTGGALRVDGIDLGGLDHEGRSDFRREHVGFVFQFFNLIPTLTARENVSLITEITRPGGDGDAAREALEAVGLGHRMDNFPGGLSGGEQQRVAVARAIAKRPSLLLGDEPTGALDLDTGKQVLGLLRRLNREQHLTVLIVTHNAAIGRMADRVLRLRDGRLVSDEANASPVEAEELDW
jgi:putative ABC transport system ATP-binding protein